MGTEGWPMLSNLTDEQEKLILGEEVNAGEISEDILQIQSPLITQDLKVSAAKILVI